MCQFHPLVKLMLVASHRDVIAAFKAKLLFLTISLEILYNLCTEKCENNALKILIHSMAGCVTFCSDSYFVKCFRIIGDISVLKTYQ